MARRTDPNFDFRRRLYGMSLWDYQRRCREQHNLCAICREPPRSGRPLQVDHDHRTNIVRGLLCGRCNVALGLTQDNPARLRGLIEYLSRAKAARPTQLLARVFEPVYGQESASILRAFHCAPAFRRAKPVDVPSSRKSAAVKRYSESPLLRSKFYREPSPSSNATAPAYRSEGHKKSRPSRLPRFGGNLAFRAPPN